jgi:hypothetical protein
MLGFISKLKVISVLPPELLMNSTVSVILPTWNQDNPQLIAEGDSGREV